MAAQSQSKAVTYQSNSQLAWSSCWRTKRTVSFVGHGANDRSARQSEIMEGRSVTLIAWVSHVLWHFEELDGRTWSHAVVVKILPWSGFSVANVTIYVYECTQTHMLTSFERAPTAIVVKTENSTIEDCLKLIEYKIRRMKVLQDRNKITRVEFLFCFVLLTSSSVKLYFYNTKTKLWGCLIIFSEMQLCFLSLIF